MLSSPKPFLDPARPRRRFQPLRALGHFRALIADKDDTAQVFMMGECLPSRRFERAARQFCESDTGQRLQREEPWLPAILDDHAALLSLPDGSVAHAYVAFMQKEGLTAAGLVAESEKPFVGRPVYDDQMGWFHNRLRDTHDLIHVLTGFGRDVLGEQCALGFSSSQYFSHVDFILAWAGGAELKRRVGRNVPVFKAIAEARAMGKRAEPVFAQSIQLLLAEPIEVARARMGLHSPQVYQQAHAIWHSNGLNPYNFLAAGTEAIQV